MSGCTLCLLESGAVSMFCTPSSSAHQICWSLQCVQGLQSLGPAPVVPNQPTKACLATYKISQYSQSAVTAEDSSEAAHEMQD